MLLPATAAIIDEARIKSRARAVLATRMTLNRGVGLPTGNIFLVNRPVVKCFEPDAVIKLRRVYCSKWSANNPKDKFYWRPQPFRHLVRA